MNHNEGEPAATTRVFLVDPAVVQVGGAIDRTKRLKYPATNYDAQDVAGNHAEQAVLELVFNDEEKPSIAVCQDTNTNVQAGDPGCPDTDFEMFESTDNIGGDCSVAGTTRRQTSWCDRSPSTTHPEARRGCRRCTARGARRGPHRVP